MQFFLRYAYAPLFWSGFIGLATWQVGYRQASHIWLVALFLGALGLSFLAERRLPYQPRWNRPHADRLRDVLHASVNESLNTLGILALPMPLRGETVSAMAAASSPQGQRPNQSRRSSKACSIRSSKARTSTRFSASGCTLIQTSRRIGSSKTCGNAARLRSRRPA
ncbi:hypothetical protein PALA35_04774 [Pseudomonas aeruginosa]|nr:hypothetical protein PALA35_04774 [Pseudomonas aeruginosa]